MEKVINIKHPDKALLCSLYLDLVGAKYRFAKSTLGVAGMLMDKYNKCVEAGIVDTEIVKVLVLGKDYRKEVREKLGISPQVFTNCIKVLKDAGIINEDIINKDYVFHDTLTFEFN